MLLVGPNGPEALAGLPDNFRLAARRLAGLLACASCSRCRGGSGGCKLDLYHATHYVLPLVVPCRSVVTIHDIIHLLYPEFLPIAASPSSTPSG